MSAQDAEPAEKCETGNGVASACGSTVKLRRELGLFSAVNLILGVMIGSGIFVSPASALEYSGSVAMCLIIWTVSGIISLLGALSFAELGTVVGKSGAEYAYFQEAFGKIHKFWGPLPSFSCAWIYVVILRPAEVAIVVMTFAEYAIQPFTPDLQADYKDKAIKLTSLAALCKMASERKKETQEILKREIKAVQSHCVDTCTVLNNAPQEFPAPSTEEAVHKALCYVEGLKTEIQNSNATLITDENLLTSQFLNETIDKTGQIEELTAFTKGVIHDLDDEINRLKTQINIAQEVKSRPRVQKREITPEHLHKAKERFKLLKTELQNLINSMFPDYSQEVTEFMGSLMSEKLNPETNGYLPITSENYQIVELLRDIDLVTTNPYNNMEVKLAY